MSKNKKNSVLIVDDENSNIIALTYILSPEYTVYAVKNGQSAIKAAEKHLPDVVLLDIIMPEMDGYAVLAALKDSEKTQHIPVIFITGLSNVDNEEKGLSLGASDYISKPFSSAIVKLRIQNQIKIINQMRAIEYLSMMDQLTGIANRRNFDQRLNAEWGRAARDKNSISIMMIDVDKFKIYNDTYGHQQGDVVLQTVAGVLTHTLKRTADFAARWGGEEFAILLPMTDIDGALAIAELIRVNVENIIIPCNDGTATYVTVSIGVNAQIPTQNDSIDDFIFKADAALYTAKGMGRNRVCCM